MIIKDEGSRHIKGNIDNGGLEGHVPFYQDLDTLSIQEVAVGGDYRLVCSYPSEPTEQERADKLALRRSVASETIKGVLSKMCWFFQDRWREKGLPTEQYHFTTPVGEIDLYNYYRELSEEHIKDLLNAITFFSNVADGAAIINTRYILIDDMDEYNEGSGENSYGMASNDSSEYPWAKHLILFPRVFHNGQYRIPGVNAWPAVITHELTHKADHKIKLNATWAKNKDFGWKYLATPIKLKGGLETRWQTVYPERCVSLYAAEIEPGEDIAESMVAARFNSDFLYPGKLEALDKAFNLRAFVDGSTIRLDRFVGNNIQLPQFPQFTFSIREIILK